MALTIARTRASLISIAVSILANPMLREKPRCGAMPTVINTDHEVGGRGSRLLFFTQEGVGGGTFQTYKSTCRFLFRDR